MKVLLINGSPQTMRALANNMAFLLKATGGAPAPDRGVEPWAPMHFIR